VTDRQLYLRCYRFGLQCWPSARHLHYWILRRQVQQKVDYLRGRCDRYVALRQLPSNVQYQTNKKSSDLWCCVASRLCECGHDDCRPLLCWTWLRHAPHGCSCLHCRGLASQAAWDHRRPARDDDCHWLLPSQLGWIRWRLCKWECAMAYPTCDANAWSDRTRDRMYLYSL
jgi:hypothetical protein